MLSVAYQQAQDNIVFIDGNSNSNKYWAKDIEEVHDDDMDNHLVAKNETLNNGP